MKIAIINQPLANRGDESAHKAFLRELHDVFPNDQIDIIFMAKQLLVDAMRLDLPNVRYINIKKTKGEGLVGKFSILSNLLPLSYLHPTLRKLRCILRSYDKIICAPGGICLGGFLDWWHLWQLLVAKELGKPIYYWGRSIGPFSDEDFVHTKFMKASKALLQYCSYVSLRDRSSIEIGKSLGVDAFEVIDSAFFRCSCGRNPQVHP